MKRLTLYTEGFHIREYQSWRLRLASTVQIMVPSVSAMTNWAGQAFLTAPLLCAARNYLRLRESSVITWSKPNQSLINQEIAFVDTRTLNA